MGEGMVEGGGDNATCAKLVARQDWGKGNGERYQGRLSDGLERL